MRFEIRAVADIGRLEERIRERLGCQGAQCACLQSAAYLNLRMMLLLKLNGIISEDAPLSVPLGGGLWLAMRGCASVVEIEGRDPPPETKKRRADPAMDTFAEQIRASKTQHSCRGGKASTTTGLSCSPNAGGREGAAGAVCAAAGAAQADHHQPCQQ
jgi:hypothetical protein